MCMNCINVDKDKKKIELIERFFCEKLYFDNCHSSRRHEQIQKAKEKARKQKRLAQRKKRIEAEAKNKVCNTLIKELVDDEFVN